MNFEREDKYIVIKKSHLTEDQINNLWRFLSLNRYPHPVKSVVVVEDDLNDKGEGAEHF